MDELGPDFITLTDDDGNEMELECLDAVEYKGETYMCFLPADMDPDDDDYGYVILKIIEENGEELFADVDDEDELNAVYDIFIDRFTAYEDDDEEDNGGDSGSEN